MAIYEMRTYTHQVGKMAEAFNGRVVTDGSSHDVPRDQLVQEIHLGAAPA
ncbi:MAG TPA: hypothetical protein VLG10_03565 [Methylomirabilota bacterium]|nr:hypothetical protein [Methylomirabilota bacterium]